MLIDKIHTLSEEFLQDIIACRRHLHQHPELSFNEVETGKFISKTLTGFGIDNELGWAGNGVVALIKGKIPIKEQWH